MQNNFFHGLALLDTSGYVIIAVILLILVTGVGTNLFIRGQYADIRRDLQRNAGHAEFFKHRVLNAIVKEATDAFERHPGEINTQVIIEHKFQSELRSLLVGERFLKSSTGLLIILGLVGTFYGLTLSIGKLVGLVSGDGAGVADVTQALMGGLTQALTGMSVAFSTSLFGIVAAILMTLLGVFSNATDQRAAAMAQVEAYIDNVLLSGPRSSDGEQEIAGGPRRSQAAGAERFEQMVSGFGQSVARLENSVAHFEAALQSFATTTRDFREFNLHLKDNIQRMSLSFGDLSETLKTHVRVLKS